MNEDVPGNVGEIEYVDYFESGDQSDQEEYFEEEFSLDCNWRRTFYKLSEAVDELRRRFSGLELCDSQIRILLSYYEFLLKDVENLAAEDGEEKNGQGTDEKRIALSSELDLDSDEGSFEMENCSRTAVSGGDILFSEDLSSEENFAG